MLNSSTVSDNTAGIQGGGISNSGILTLTSSTVRDNTAAGDGGGDLQRHRSRHLGLLICDR